MQTRKTLAAAAIGLALAAAAQAEITVGVSLGTTGPGASLGIPYKNAFQLVPSTIAGEPVRYVILDDESKPDNAAKNARKFVTEDKVDVLMGSNGVPSGVAITQVAAEARTLTGAVVVATCGIYLIYREQQLKKATQVKLDR